MKILLTGATGFIGMNFIERYCNKYDIVALVRKSSKIDKIKNKCKIYYYDENNEQILNSLKKENIQGVVHLATKWISTHNQNDIVHLINSNITFGVQLLEITQKLNVNFFINTSTFGSYCNSFIYRPSSLYAATKKAYEDIMCYYALINKSVFTNLLLFNVYGSNDCSVRLFNLLNEIAKTDNELLMSDGSQIVDYSHVYDIVDGFDCLIELIQKDPEFCKNKIFSLKGKERKSLKEVVALYEEVLGKKLNIKWGARMPRELEIMQPWEGGEKLPNWEQKINLKEGFLKMINEK
ncbi:NAD(P)-dependent oxidoreductase [Campylobacter coli]|nr:NAD(P)-dependent oxidoreductase [Campylobacter coli]